MPRALILAPQRRSMVSSSPITTGAPVGTKALTNKISSWRAAARDDHAARLRIRWKLQKLGLRSRPRMRNAVETVRRPGAKTAPASNNSTFDQVGHVNRSPAGIPATCEGDFRRPAATTPFQLHRSAKLRGPDKPAMPRPPSWGLLTAGRGCRNKRGTSQRERPDAVRRLPIQGRPHDRRLRGIGKGLEHPNRPSRLSNAEAEVSEGPDRASAKSAPALASER